MLLNVVVLKKLERAPQRPRGLREESLKVGRVGAALRDREDPRRAVFVGEDVGVVGGVADVEDRVVAARKDEQRAGDIVRDEYWIRPLQILLEARVALKLVRNLHKLVKIFRLHRRLISSWPLTSHNLFVPRHKEILHSLDEIPIVQSKQPQLHALETYARVVAWIDGHRRLHGRVLFRFPQVPHERACAGGEAERKDGRLWILFAHALELGFCVVGAADDVETRRLGRVLSVARPHEHDWPEPVFSDDRGDVVVLAFFGGETVQHSDDGRLFRERRRLPVQVTEPHLPLRPVSERHALALVHHRVPPRPELLPEHDKRALHVGVA
mmetsp:Transcript_17146/g.56113  ORF Transcript_17146/g.56113 Transcript_17146/m.56113 type:complete len:326 (+) Transcript_17146:112-1089(+)